MKILSTVQALQEWRGVLRGSVGFVPTMGALHRGHIALMDAAKARCDHTLASIFVNSKQFGVNEDLSRYPRPLADDIALLESAGVNALFAPEAEELYPNGFATTVSVARMDEMLCGAHRVGHFAGVTTVVALLFSLTRPHAAFFGEKDFQQLAILTRMNADMRLVEEMVGIPTVREADGLALSSRNRYLSAEERRIAPRLYHTLCAVRQAGGGVAQCKAAAAQLEAEGFAVEYLEMRDTTTLAITEHTANARIFVAARLGTTRLIDNVAAGIAIGS
jgi:pantoate--beta-alanine ligase